MNSFLRHTAAFTCRQCRSSLSSAAAAVRRVHTRQQLPYPIEAGLPPFLSPPALKLIAVDWQEGLLSELNNLIERDADGDYKNKSVHQIVIDSASKRSDITIFNYASQALNNSFFLNNLISSATPRHPTGKFLQAITQHFGGVPQLQSTMSAAVEGMVGSGWVWLVVDGGGRLAVVATYGAGTMLVGSRKQTDPFTVEKGSGAKSQSSASSAESAEPLHTDALMDSQKNFQHWGSVLNPIFCISVHEHAWLTDYGVWGKVEYLKRFWKVLNWSTVSNHWSAWEQSRS